MDYDALHKKRLQRYLNAIEKAFDALILDVASLYLRTKLKDELFLFRKYPDKIKLLDKLLANYHTVVMNTVKVGIGYEWEFANMKNDAINAAKINRLKPRLPNDKYTELINRPNPRNLEALSAFKKRKVKDFTISERVWKSTRRTKVNLEYALDDALREGLSAQDLAKKIKVNLNEPDKLFRRVRDRHGKLNLSKAAKNFHPGQGVYRSAHKNALRLAANEINVAYKESDRLRLNQNKDVVGFEVYLSPNHTIVDMCDDLKGKYPKDFVFNGWHVRCNCGIKSVLKTDDELIDEIMQGINTDESINKVRDVPLRYRSWVKENEPKMKKSKPNFITANKKYL